VPDQSDILYSAPIFELNGGSFFTIENLGNQTSYLSEELFDTHLQRRLLKKQETANAQWGRNKIKGDLILH